MQKPLVRGKPYITRRNHGNHPAGSKCFARRSYDKIILHFLDGDTVVISGQHYFLPGIDKKKIKWLIEKIPKGFGIDSFKEDLAKHFHESICSELDREVWTEMNLG